MAVLSISEFHHGYDQHPVSRCAEANSESTKVLLLSNVSRLNVGVLSRSGTPHGTRRAIPRLVAVPLRADPPTTILPSGWITTSLAVSKPPKKSIRASPAVPNVVSSAPTFV